MEWSNIEDSWSELIVSASDVGVEWESLKIVNDFAPRKITKTDFLFAKLDMRIKQFSRMSVNVY